MVIILSSDAVKIRDVADTVVLLYYLTNVVVQRNSYDISCKRIHDDGNRIVKPHQLYRLPYLIAES